METSIELLRRAQGGDRKALNDLLARYRPGLCSWAHARLPRELCSIQETEDLVQETLVRALDHLEGFQPRHEGALIAYLRTAVRNRIRDEFRRHAHRPQRAELDSRQPDAGGDPLQLAIGAETFERFERALERLPPEQREAVILRVEFGKSHQEIAAALDKPTPDAARMFVARALLAVAKEMGRTP